MGSDRWLARGSAPLDHRVGALLPSVFSVSAQCAGRQAEMLITPPGGSFGHPEIGPNRLRETWTDQERQVVQHLADGKRRPER
jgi:hypothetical protein